MHHQSQDYNLSTALRQTSSGALLGWVFYVPMALAGVPPLVFRHRGAGGPALQFWVHTEHVPKLGWFDRWFCSPSNHRVHHAVNDRYLDRNYGGVLIIWDRMFGSFRRKTRNAFTERAGNSGAGTRSGRIPRFTGACSKTPGMREAGPTSCVSGSSRRAGGPADVAARFPGRAFDIAAVERYHPAVSPAVLWFGAVQFVLLLQGVAVFLWFAEAMPVAQAAMWLAALTAGLWAVGAVLQGRLGMMEVLLVEAAALSTVSSAAGLTQLHHLSKPLAMVLAIACVGLKARHAGGVTRFDMLLMAALAGSMAGDVLLMLRGLFIPGLVAFLVAHLFYIALFRQGVAWFPARWALPVTLGLGTVMYAFLWSGLNPVLKLAVAAYVVVIALMAAQAIGRAMVLRDRASACVAAGACFFMLSDSILATNRFAMPVPLAQFWVLSTYYVAQILIACNAQRSRPSASSPQLQH